MKKGTVKVIKKLDITPEMLEKSPNSTKAVDKQLFPFISTPSQSLHSKSFKDSSVNYDTKLLVTKDSNKIKKALLETLLNIKTSKFSVNCTLKRKLIKNEDQGILYYTQELDNQYKAYCRSWNIEVKNNLLVLLFKLGEFSTKYKCQEGLYNQLENFALNQLYVRLHKISKIIYKVWRPRSEFELLKAGKISFYWFEELNLSDVENFRKQIH
ncbi:hypothetical protein CONCODRAFT_6187 [Conidiobolus coronatus NRRL 28638]|uniref:Uncharacterized protein n=1 Tax=Conidiobolus coronatus (strain ATCC 28846 / CBS 209.66 / NRRL 28638) TaxID=796925 RepID=A0A137P835_CONC2|nr:hypothetical protein CONCODRAFT_6187 [Conidiobolus coronatus NRRL 28638]|eukprot:KXN71160.1 hypothetical protein CONCODRAFT_6187 [Conidiobolus coronatus NRRL 28638]